MAAHCAHQPLNLASEFILTVRTQSCRISLQNGQRCLEPMRKITSTLASTLHRLFLSQKKAVHFVYKWHDLAWLIAWQATGHAGADEIDPLSDSIKRAQPHSHLEPDGKHKHKAKKDQRRHKVSGEGGERQIKIGTVKRHHQAQGTFTPERWKHDPAFLHEEPCTSRSGQVVTMYDANLERIGRKIDPGIPKRAGVDGKSRTVFLHLPVKTTESDFETRVSHWHRDRETAICRKLYPAGELLQISGQFVLHTAFHMAVKKARKPEAREHKRYCNCPRCP
jgi:hypothetical protein